MKVSAEQLEVLDNQFGTLLQKTAYYNPTPPKKTPKQNKTTLSKKKNPTTIPRKNKNKLVVSIYLTLSLSHLSFNIVNLFLEV